MLAMDAVPPLTDLERELLELCSIAGETTTTRDEEMLVDSPGRPAVELALRGLLKRGLLSTRPGTSAEAERTYVDDWWDVTAMGREASGLPPRPLPS
jgi:hypothetical protein